MAVKREHIGETRSGEPVYAYRLSNRAGLGVTIWNLGASIKSIVVPTKKSGPVEICHAPQDIKSHISSRFGAGAILGPNWNHTKEDGIQKRVWAASEGDGEISFSIEIADGEFGQPGSMTVRAVYSLDAGCNLKVCVQATCDRKTPILLTRSLGLNLRGRDAGSVEADYMQIFASRYLPVGQDLSPAPDTVPVQGTPFDFTVPKELGGGMSQDTDQLRICGGYDHCFLLDSRTEGVSEAAVCSSPSTGITLQVSTDLPCLRLRARMAKNQPGDKGMNSFCIGTQLMPASNVLFTPDEPFDATTVYRFL